MHSRFKLPFYLRAGVLAFKSRLIYRKSTLLHILSAAVYIAVAVLVWVALLGGGAHQGTTLPQMITYIIITRLVNILLNFRIGYKISDRIRTGTIECDMVRPYNLKTYLLFEDIGSNMFEVVAIFGPLLLLVALGYGFAPPQSLFAFCFFLLSIVMGAVLLFLYRSIIAAFGFWLIRNPFLSWHYQNVEQFFSGSMVPIWFYPVWLAPFTYILPFRYFTYEPLAIYLGKTPVDQVWRVLLVQGAWLLVLWVIDRVLWARAYNKLVVQGG